MFWILVFVFFTCSSFASESITGKDAPYLKMCLKAAFDPAYFQVFRSLPDYSHAVEISEGLPFAEYLLQNRAVVLDSFRKLDAIGSPLTQFYPGLGSFSATTLRYIAIGDQLSKLFQLPKRPTIVEIGAGFGGQCYVLAELLSFSKYYIYDLPEANALITKTMQTLHQRDVHCLGTEEALPEDSIDLFISNYSFSECDEETQIDYFHRIIKRAKRGYVLYNQTSHIYSITSLTPEAFVALLEREGLKPMVLNEPVPTFSGNLLIIWDASNKI